MLTALELSIAFPEMVPRARARIRELKELTRHWDDCFTAVSWAPGLYEVDPRLPERYEDLGNPNQWPVESISASSKWFWIQVVRCYRRNDDQVKELEMLTEYVRLVKYGPKLGEKRDLAAIKAIPIESLYSFSSKGKRGNVICPLHSESTPSFHIYRDSNTFHCFGCGAHGDSIAFYMQLHQVNFLTAIKALGGEDEHNGQSSQEGSTNQVGQDRDW
jgi:hypothetical protein